MLRMWAIFFGGGVLFLFFYKRMFFSTTLYCTLIGVIIFTFLGGEFWSNLSYLFYKFIYRYVVSTILLYHVCGGRCTDGWLGQVVGTCGY